MLRQRKPIVAEEEAESPFVESIKKLDAFAKVPDQYKKSSKIGGFREYSTSPVPLSRLIPFILVSLISRLLIAYVVYVEFQYYLDSRLIFKFLPDDDMDTKIRVNLDLTVASPCHAIGADIADSTNQYGFGEIQEIDTWWELDESQQAYFDYMKSVNTYLREQYHSIAHVIFKDVVTKIDMVTTYSLPERHERPTKPFDACRLVGELSLNKVAGNFHITAGKSLHFPRGGHVHLMNFFDPGAQNFTHRINRFSFGQKTSGIVHPLEGDEFVALERAVSVQYYIDVVQTEIHSFLSHQKTFQYSVKENSRPIGE